MTQDCALAQIPLFLSNSWALLVVILFLVPLDKACFMRKRSENRLKLPNSSLRKKKTPVKSPPQALIQRDSD